MAIPTVTSITPSSGLTGGESFIIIEGTNFDLAEVGEVEVLFGTEPAELVQVRSSTVLGVKTPRHDVGTVDITVTNKATSESVVVSNAFTFVRPSLTRQDTELQRLTEELITIMRIEIMQNVWAQIGSSHTDYATEESSQVNKEYQSTLPVIILKGPDLQENRFYSVNFGITTINDTTGETNKYHEPYTVDVIFTLVGAARNRQEASSLYRETINFFRRNEFIKVKRPLDSPIQDKKEIYEMDIVRPGFSFLPSIEDEMNIFQFSGEIMIRGFDIFEDQPFEQSKRVSETTPSIPGLPFDADIDFEIESIT